MKKIITRFEKRAQLCCVCYSKIEIQGKLSCCTHYFCYKCILHWSKIENSCPLCKLRFSSIERIAHRHEYKEKQLKKKKVLVEHTTQQEPIQRQNWNFESLRLLLLRLCEMRRAGNTPNQMSLIRIGGFVYATLIL